MDKWEELNESREEALAQFHYETESARVRAIVLALLYIGDCIRSLTDRERV